ncbi:MAG: hypothetical protein PWR20_1415 [Bacteroidales bacterium]|jgi:hypothetical protein|nr:hypothetical protein [Bacteroidales bacterium]MDN5329657.1 hypothetical protein [Bacteroidales bacterium]
MDDLLTILLVVGWMVLGIYQNSRKQKKRAETKRQAAERERQRSSPQSGPVYPSTRPQENRPQKPLIEETENFPQEPNLEEVLGELLGMPAKPKPVAKPREPKPVETVKAEPYSPLAYTPLVEQINKPQYESIEFREEHQTPGYHIQDAENVQWSHPELEGFDLRKAVIYSAILNRPYS